MIWDGITVARPLDEHPELVELLTGLGAMFVQSRPGFEESPCGCPCLART